MTTVAIVQARMRSTRLPGKVLAEISGRPMVLHVLERAASAPSINEVVLATSRVQEDDPLAELVTRAGFRVFRGSETDVLDRYHLAAKATSAKIVVRVTADCPLLDPEVLERTLRLFLEGGYDYVSNTLVPTFPDGLDVEVMKRGALDRAWREAKLPSEREHVTPFIWKQPHLFRQAALTNEEDLSALRWTVDEPADLAFVRAIYEKAGPGTFGLRRVLEILRAHVDIARINHGFGRNEGYLKSLEADTP